MPHFSLSFDGGGPLLRMVVAVSDARALALQTAGKAIPQAQVVTALVDTGASSTCIDPAILQALELTATGSCDVHTPSTAGAPAKLEQYDVGLMIRGSDASQSPLIFPVMPVIATPLSPQGIQALIGRDLLAHCVLHYNGSTGLFTLAF